MSKSEDSKLQVYHAGSVTVVGFGGQTVTDRIDFSLYQPVLSELVQRHSCQVLAVDLAGVSLVPAGMLGVMVSLRKLVKRIEIHNPSAAAKESLETIRIDSLFHIHESTA